jgi:HK97 family phage portal protein
MEHLNLAEVIANARHAITPPPVREPDSLKAITALPAGGTGITPRGISPPINSAPGVIMTSLGTNLALSSAAVWACCRLISTSIAALPTDLFSITKDGKIPALSHPLYGTLTMSPNPLMTSQQWIQPILLSLLLYGNGYTWVDRVGNDVLGIWPLNPARVTVLLNPDGTLSYSYVDLKGRYSVFTDDQIIHMRVFTLDGLIGLPVLVYHRASLDFQQASSDYALALYRNGGQPGGVLEYPGVLKKEQVDRIRDSWNSLHSGAGNAGRIAILEEGTKYTAIGVPPDQLEYIEEQRFSVEQIARIFGVPPHLIGALDKPTYASVEQMSLEFVRYTLYPYIRTLEQTVNRALELTPEYQWRFNLDAFERADISSRYRSYATGRQWGWLSANDVRRMEDLNTVEDGDIYLTPLNMVPAGTDPVPADPVAADPADPVIKE